MAEESRESMKPELAIALAHGVSVGAWARAHDVPRSTVYRWALEPEVRKMSEACRRRLMDQAIGRVTKRTSWIFGGITKLAECAESESVRLKALRGLLSDMMAVSRFSVLESRMVEIEEQISEQRAGDAGHQG
jgi:hypothetical protein